MRPLNLQQSVYKPVKHNHPSDQWIPQFHNEQYFASEDDHRPFDTTSELDLLLQASFLSPGTQPDISSSTNDGNKEISFPSTVSGGHFNQIGHMGGIRPLANPGNADAQAENSPLLLNLTGELSDEWRM